VSEIRKGTDAEGRREDSDEWVQGELREYSIANILNLSKHEGTNIITSVDCCMSIGWANNLFHHPIL
jgi:hypothetical protein